MRTKRVILLRCSDDDRRSELTFVLTTKGYRVISDGPADLDLTLDLTFAGRGKRLTMTELLERVRVMVRKRTGPYQPASPVEDTVMA
jgi:hypothetical protein